jgi:hypothetical protein
VLCGFSEDSGDGNAEAFDYSGGYLSAVVRAGVLKAALVLLEKVALHSLGLAVR